MFKEITIKFCKSLTDTRLKIIEQVYIQKKKKKYQADSLVIIWLSDNSIKIIKKNVSRPLIFFLFGKLTCICLNRLSWKSGFQCKLEIRMPFDPKRGQSDKSAVEPNATLF